MSFPIRVAVLLSWSAALCSAASEEGSQFFERKVEPILRESCFKCHSHSAEKIKGGLVLDSREAALTGGDTGPAVVPGDADKSLLIEAIGYKNADLQMPPKGKQLGAEQVAVLTQWVKMGAPWPDSGGQKMSTRPKGRITEEDRKWWSFQPIAEVAPPKLDDGGWCANDVDRFVFKKLADQALKPAPRAEPEQLVRRVYFDVIGLPPTPAEVDTFVHGQETYADLVDRLLESPQYGEHWARHWLDLVRYAESDGYKADEYRPDAWRYRDYVIDAFNRDKPYDRFVQEQLAGDELFPGQFDALVATGFLRHGIYEYNNRDAIGQWTNMLNDITDVTADVFMGLGLQCARCHDHKFDPILQKDYFRLQAFFAPLAMPEKVTFKAPEEQTAQLKVWKQKTASLRAQIDGIVEPVKKKDAEAAIKKFPPDVQAMLRKPAAERTPWEEQIAEIAYRQVTYEWDHLLNKMRGSSKDKLVGLQRQLAAFDSIKPPSPAVLQCARDVGSAAPPVTIPKKASAGEVEPGFLTLLDEMPAVIEPSGPHSTGRRTALARWLTDPRNPLTARVAVNRVWQYHFGRGLVANASDFGKLGDAPSHPELLDWLASRFIAEGWSFKKLHRTILLSAAYQQSTHNPMAETARLKDPENRWLWRASTRRMDAEQIRDAILSVTGELQPESTGPSVDAATPRRTIYTKVLRNTRDPVLDVFDVPEGFTSMAQRNVTTTPTQCLLMMNSPWSLHRAQAFAGRLRRESSEDEARVVSDAYRLAMGRAPSAAESDAALKFLEEQTRRSGRPRERKQIAPFTSEKMPMRDGRAAVFTPGTSMDRLTIPDNPAFPSGDFTAEAFIVLRSLYEDGEVRTIVAQGDGHSGHPGWSLGVTGKKSRYKPQTLVLLLSGDHPWSDKDPVEPIFSGLHIELGRPYFVAVSVDLDDAGERGVTFYTKDLANDDEPIQVATLSHKVTSGIRSPAPLQVGARGADDKNLFDGLVDDVRISNVALAAEHLLINDPASSEHTVGYWKFENDPGVYKDSSQYGGDIEAKIIDAPKIEPRASALVDFCHVLLNSNEFLYVD